MHSKPEMSVGYAKMNQANDYQSNLDHQWAYQMPLKTRKSNKNQTVIEYCMECCLETQRIENEVGNVKDGTCNKRQRACDTEHPITLGNNLAICGLCLV